VNPRSHSLAIALAAVAFSVPLAEVRDDRIARLAGPRVSSPRDAPCSGRKNCREIRRSKNKNGKRARARNRR